MESSFKLVGVKSEFTAPPSRLPETRSVKRARRQQRAPLTMRLAQARIINADDWSALDFAESSARRSAYTTGATNLLRTSTAAHHEQVARLSGRRASIAPIVSAQPELVLSTATPNGPNAMPAAHSAVGRGAVTR